MIDLQKTILNKSGTNYRWYVLSLAALTHAFAIAMPNICMSVLFDEISHDLQLSLVEIGFVWGLFPLAGIFFIFVGGLLADRYGIKRVVSTACLMAGLAGALRGVSENFTGLMVTTFLFGSLVSILAAGAIKTASVWFSGRQLGFAMGILATGMGIGFTLSAMISAAILSPWLGGWRNVLFLYGAVSIIIGLLWLFTVRGAERIGSSYAGDKVSLWQTIRHVLSVKAVWLLGLTMLGYTGCIQGMTGYLPLYLRNSGWTETSADGTLAAFTGFSTIGAIPLTILSDRLGLRKAVIFPIIVTTILGIALLSVANGAMVWLLVIMVGIARDGFHALCITMNIETRGIGAAYAASGVAFMQTILRIGPFIAPPIGNSFADMNMGLPFIIWAAFGLVALISLFFVRETGWTRT